MTSPELTIEELTLIARNQNAYVLTDKDGDIAIQFHIYNEDDTEIVRHQPDPGNFRPLAWWAARIQSGRGIA